VLYDNDRRLLFALSFENDWDRYFDDAVAAFGLAQYNEWLQHTMEVLEEAIMNLSVAALKDVFNAHAVATSCTKPTTRAGSSARSARTRDA
jgi:hypothetical protein